jgi:hypothetical protein
LKYSFSYVTRRALSNYNEKRKKNHFEIFNCGHIIYTINILKFEYLCPGKPSAAHILNSSVSQWVWPFAPYTVVHLAYQDRPFHCKIFYQIQKIWLCSTRTCANCYYWLGIDLKFVFKNLNQIINRLITGLVYIRLELLCKL